MATKVFEHHLTGYCSDLRVDEGRKTFIESAVGQWSFSAHDFTSDELVFAASTMIQHALSIPELDKWRLPVGKQKFIHYTQASN